MQDGIAKSMAQALHQKDLHKLTPAEFKGVREKAEEKFLTFLFLDNSAHTQLKRSLKNGFAKGDDKYPDNRQDALNMLSNFSEPVPQPNYVSEGTSFGQVDTPGSREFDREFWKGKTCRCCGGKDHPAWSHTKEERKAIAKARQEKAKEAKQKSDDEDDESKGSSKSNSKGKSSKKPPSKKKITKGGKAARIQEAANMFTAHLIEYLEAEMDDHDDDEWSNEDQH